MSAQVQYHWDPVKRVYIYYDTVHGIWRCSDGTPHDEVGSANQDDETGEDEPRWSQDAHPQLLEQQRSAEYGTSPPGSQYIPESSHAGITAAFSGLAINGEPSEADGDETPREFQYGRLEREPKQHVTDPSLFKRGMESRGKIKATPGRKERLDPEFKCQRHPKEFFVPGKVFRILWPEHPGYQTENVTVITDGGGYRGQDIITKFRWFVVVKAGTNFCSCLPITTYNRRGVTKPGVEKSDHSVICSTKEEPPLLQGEEPEEGEDGMMPYIRVVPKRQSEKMDARSRLDYSRVYTVDHFVKVKEFGDVHKSYVKRLRKQWWLVVKASMEEDGTDGEEDAAEEWVVALHAYNDNPEMMELEVGDRIRVTDKTTDYWWKGVNARSGIENLFPASYVEELSEE